MDKKALLLTLPWPPSANTYWRRNGSRYFISPKGQDYRQYVLIDAIHGRNYFDKDSRIKLIIEAYPPDKRKRDLDNLFKSLLDSLQFARVFPDDNQIDILYIQRMPENLNKIELALFEIN